MPPVKSEATFPLKSTTWIVMSRKRLGQQLKDPPEAPRLNTSISPKLKLSGKRTCQVGLASLLRVCVKLTTSSRALLAANPPSWLLWAAIPVVARSRGRPTSGNLAGLFGSVPNSSSSASSKPSPSVSAFVGSVP